MQFQEEQDLVAEIKKYVTENLPLSKMSDEELEEQAILYKTYYKVKDKYLPV